jgi:hypothetical protein
MEKWQSAAEAFFALVLGAICFSIFRDDVWRVFQSSDTAWLVKTGEYVLTHGLPVTDIFSWTHSDRPWVIYQWFFELCAGGLYMAGGLWLAGLGGLLVFSLIYFWLLPSQMIKTGVKPVFAIAILSLIITPAWFWLRPQLFSFLLIVVFMNLLEDFRQNGLKPVLWWLPPLMVLWTNSHSFWFIGLILIFSYLASALRAKTQRHRKQLIAIAIASSLALFINPYGANILAYNYSFVSRPEIAAIKELHPILLTEPLAHCLLLLYFALCWGALILGRRHVPSTGLWLSASFTFAALCCYRFAPLGVLITWPYLSIALSNWEITRSDANGETATGLKIGKRGRLIANLAPPLLAVTACLLSYVSVFPYKHPIWFTHQYSNKGAVDFLKENPKLLDHMFCDDALGCSLILENLGPVFIDTRFDFYGQDFCNQFRRCLYAHDDDDWRNLFDSWKINSAGARNNAPLCQELKHRSSWTCVFDDGQYSIFARVKERN